MLLTLEGLKKYEIDKSNISLNTCDYIIYFNFDAYALVHALL